MTNKKVKCYCNICKRRRELGLEPTHKIIVEEDGEVVVTRRRFPRFFRRKKRKS